ncbi:MAG TPA: hypothetical protein VFG84_10280 [Gemmatimonadaceae bacterium]|nr:hypothetical protein [Gemmatimonadaceae bacterium]
MLRIARSLVVSVVVVGAIMLAVPAGAQQQGVAEISAPRATPAPAPTTVTAADAATPTVLGPAMSTATAGFRPDAAATTATNEQGPQLPENGNRRKGAIFMIVGGAAMLGGAIVGEEAGAVIMIGGVLMTLYGLYTYLN